MVYLITQQVLFVHDRLIIETGGEQGIRDLNLLEAAVYRPQFAFDNTNFYPDIFTKAASLLQSIIQNHPFIDGNKQTGIISTKIYLNMNNCSLKISYQEFEQFTIDIVTKHPSIEWIAS